MAGSLAAANHRPHCAQWGCLAEGPEQSEVAHSRWVSVGEIAQTQL